MRSIFPLFIMLCIFLSGCVEQPIMSLRNGETPFLPDYHIGMELEKDDPNMFVYYEESSYILLPSDTIIFNGISYDYIPWHDKDHMNDLTITATLPSDESKEQLIKELERCYGKPYRTGVYWDYEWYDGFISLWVDFTDDNNVSITYLKGDIWFDEDQQ